MIRTVSDGTGTAPAPLDIPHRPRDGLCPVNGLRDLVQWRTGIDWSNEFLWGLGQGGGFVYLRINPADPPRQVYWGNASSRQHEYLAGLLGAGLTATEGRSFKFAWDKAREALERGTPPVLGPLDMFNLPFCEGLYHRRHVPIHYVLLAGVNEETLAVWDTGHEEAQELELDDLRLAWDVNVPGQGKRNRVTVFEVPVELPEAGALVRQSVADQCRTMLTPPVKLLGVPAMKRLANDLPGWPAELGEDVAAACLRQLREYLNSPPDLEGDHLTAGRDLYVTFLEEAGPMAGLDFSAAIGRLRASIVVVPEVAAAIAAGDLGAAAACFARIADIETAAWDELRALVTEPD